MIADIPGLIEGASAGAGLGHDFLAHIERTRLLVHVLDLAPLDGSDPEANYATVERELELHNPRLAVLPRVLALSKADLVDEEAREAARAALGGAARSGHAGGRDVVGHRARAPPSSPASCPARPGADRRGRDRRPARRRDRRSTSSPSTACSGRRPTAPTRSSRSATARYRVTGKGIERLVARYDLDNEDALAYLERRLRGIGVIRALEAEGFEPGDEVEIAGIAFDLDPE